ncbi:unnamed protein product [Cercopithifilaria johnstoni]|uniref:Uncharacterized protein n=1 Tax=Cercopithifilaria johnstoni TaxID=2874296 RepID=A0A8J2Q0S3_9BILA|nr:unnamed protein product [Cercopithifilaria johnstoni]
MPPQRSLIAELLRKQTKAEQTECESSLGLQVQESSYYNLDLQVGDDVKLTQPITTSFSNTGDQSAENTQRNTYQHPLNNTKMIFHDFLKLSDSGSAELPTGRSRDSLNSHDALEIFAWNQKKKWENPGGSSTFGTTSEYCYCSNINQPY